MRTSREEILDAMLRTLIGVWGHSVVLQHLEKLRDESPLRSDFRSLPENATRAEQDRWRGEDRRHIRRPSAFEHLGKIELPQEKKEQLRELALRFDRKQFLPSIGAVRNFLEWKGIHRERIRTREEMIPLIVQQLLDIPKDELESILKEDHGFGPSRLGPLSDAIKSTSAIIRRRDQAD